MKALRSSATKERSFTKAAKVPGGKKLAARVKEAVASVPEEERLHLAGGLGDVYGGGYTPQQLALLNKMQQGQYDYTFGPGSPGATKEDLQTYVGGKYSPAGGFARHGGWALAPKDYYSFSPSQRRQHNIMDIAPSNQAGKLERYFAAGRHGFGGGGGGRMDRTEPGGSGGYIGLGEPSSQGFAGYSPPDWGRQDYGGSVGVGGFGGDYAPGAYTGYVDSYGNPTSDAYGPARASAAGQPSGAEVRNAIGQDYSSNLQGSTNPLDYINPFGGTTKGGAGTGVPTQKAVGTVVGTLSNFFLPGSGFLTGPLARYATSLLQGGMSKQQAAQAVQEAQKSGKIPGMPSGSVSLPTHQQGGGFDPYGNPARGRQYWSSDFGRGPGGYVGGYNLAGPGGQFGTKGVGFGGNTVGNFGTAIGFQGSYGGGSNAGYLGPSAAGMNRPYTAQEWGALPGTKKYAAPILTQAEGGATPRMGYQQYLSMWHPSGGGVGVGFGKQSGLGHTPKLAQFAKGEDDIPPFLAEPDLANLARQQTEEQRQTMFDELEARFRARGVPPLRSLTGKGDLDPRDVPIFDMLESGGRRYDPHYSGQDRLTLAAKGKHTVQAVQGNTDTVPAMLTPREAVLNRNAAELAGRGNIEQLNAEGNKLAEKGVDLAGGKHMKRQKLQAGGEVDPLTMYKNKLGGGPQPYGAPQAVVGGGTPNTPPEWSGGMPYGGGGGGGPYQTPPGYGEPHQGQYGGVGRNNYFRHQQRSGSFFPGRGGQGFAGGTADLQAQADPFWKGSDLPQLTAGKVDLEALKKHAQQNGMTAEQISGIVKAMGAMGGNGYGSAADMATAPTGAGYQGGISDIGYPPFIAPNATYHADKGSSWVGPYDPAYYIPRQQ